MTTTDQSSQALSAQSTWCFDDPLRPRYGPGMPTTKSPPAVLDLDQRIRRLYDHLYANASRRTPAAIAQEVGKVLHAAQYAEEVLGRVPAFQFTKSEIRAMTRGSGELVIPVASEIRSAFKEMNEEWRIYDSTVSIEFADSDLAFVAAQLSDVVVSDRKRDVFGDAVEIFRSQWAKREGGMFFTDQRVTHIAMELLQFDPRTGDDLVDISAGTGGFLSAGLNRIRYLLERDEPGPDVEAKAVELAATCLKGQEIDDDVARVANATLASRTGRVSHQFVGVGDSISPQSFDTKSNGCIREGVHLCAASNPPFGTKTTIKDDGTLRHYELARLTSRGRTEAITNDTYSRPPDILLLERNVRLLAPGRGRLAIVLPYQILSGPQTQFVRDWLLRNLELEAVIDLPPETFQPHTGTKTSLVVGRRREHPIEQPSRDGQKVFMAIPRWIGHDRRGNPVYERGVDGRTTGRILSDFDRVEAAFQAFLAGEDPSEVYDLTFAVDEAQIADDEHLRINAAFYRPSAHTMRVSPRSRTWRTVRVEDVVKRIFYPGRFKRHYVDHEDGAVPFFGGSNITELIISTSKWLASDDPRLEELRVQAGWVLVTRSGSTGIVSSVPPAWDGVAMSEHVIRIEPDNKKLPGEYLQCFLRTPQGQEMLARNIFGSVIDEISPEMIGGLEIPVPKNADELQQIVKEIRAAERARNKAIEGIHGAVDRLASKLSNG